MPRLPLASKCAFWLIIAATTYLSHAKAAFVGLSVYGALLEVMQSTLTSTRQGDPLDWLADNVGILLVVILFYWLRRTCPNLA